MKKFNSLLVIAFFAVTLAFTSNAHAQLGGMINKAKSKAKDAGNKTKSPPPPKTADKNAGDSQTQTNSDDEDSDSRAENAKNLAKASGMPKAANTDAALNKLLFQAADDTRLIPRKVVVVDKDWLTTTGARNAKVRRIFAVVGRTTESGKCGKQMVQFDQDWKEDKNNWGLIYVQNVGEITPIACGAIGK